MIEMMMAINVMDAKGILGGRGSERVGEKARKKRLKKRKALNEKGNHKNSLNLTKREKKKGVEPMPTNTVLRKHRPSTQPS